MSVTISTTQRPAYHGYYAKNTVPKFLITTNDEIVTATLTMQGHTFSASYAPDFNGHIEVDFSQLYGDYIETLMPNGSADSVSQTSAIITCEASFSGSTSGAIAYPLGYPWIWYVFNAKLNSATPFETWVQQNFLTNQPIEKPTTYDSPEWLTWFDLDGSRKLVVRFYPKTGGNVDTTVKTDNTAGCYSENVSYSRLIRMINMTPRQLNGYYDLILFDNQNNEICRQRYIYEERTGREHYFLFVNALGGIDTLICQGENILQPEVTHNIGRFGRQYKALDDTDDCRHWQQQTGLVPYRWRNWIHDLLSSKQAASKYDQESDTINPIVVDESEISMSDGGQLASATFGYMMTEVDNVMADTERALERSNLHASIAEQAEALHDETVQVTLAFADDGNGGSATEEVTLPATKLYVEFEPTKSTTIDYAIDGKQVGDFDPSEDTSPVVITKGAGESIQFSSKDFVLEEVVISYYPVTIQAL